MTLEGRMMNDQNDNLDPLLATGLAALRGELAGHDAPRCVEKELLQAFARQFPKKQPWYRKLSLPQWGTAGALASLCGVAVLLALAPHQAITVGPPVIGVDDGAAFIALESLERIEREPYTGWSRPSCRRARWRRWACRSTRRPRARRCAPKCWWRRTAIPWRCA
jgi:hypothetical protein